MDRVFEVQRLSNDFYQVWDLTECREKINKKQVVLPKEEWGYVAYKGNGSDVIQWMKGKGVDFRAITFKIIDQKGEQEDSGPFDPLQGKFANLQTLYILMYDPSVEQ